MAFELHTRIEVEQMERVMSLTHNHVGMRSILQTDPMKELFLFSNYSLPLLSLTEFQRYCCV